MWWDDAGGRMNVVVVVVVVVVAMYGGMDGWMDATTLPVSTDVHGN